MNEKIKTEDIEYLNEEQEKEKAGKELMLHSLFNSILILIFRRMALPMKKDAGIGDDMLSFIKANCSEPLTLEEIAEANHYNAAYNSSNCHTGKCRPQNTAKSVRCSIAASTLRSSFCSRPSLRLGILPQRLGFPTAPSFSELFRSRQAPRR